MQNGTSKYENGNFEQHNVSSKEIKKWIELWFEVRKTVTSNLEAYQELSRKGLRYRDPRTIKAHIEPLLPLVKLIGLPEVLRVLEYCEGNLPLPDLFRMIRERIRIEELAQLIGNMADSMIEGMPAPSQVVRALGSILSGGFPFDNHLNGR